LLTSERIRLSAIPFKAGRPPTCRCRHPSSARWRQSTPAEREIALFILKGLSAKEIADLRDTSERTIRQQAQAIYSKANLSGRAALSAFFLEDLLVPIDRNAAMGNG